MIPKNKKRVSLTLHEDTIKVIKSLIPLLKARNESEVVEYSVIAMAAAIFQQMNEQLSKGEQNNEEN